MISLPKRTCWLFSSHLKKKTKINTGYNVLNDLVSESVQIYGICAFFLLFSVPPVILIIFLFSKRSLCSLYTEFLHLYFFCPEQFHIPSQTQLLNNRFQWKYYFFRKTMNHNTLRSSWFSRVYIYVCVCVCVCVCMYIYIYISKHFYIMFLLYIGYICTHIYLYIDLCTYYLFLYGYIHIYSCLCFTDSLV
jgi:hypothetical protein